MILAAAPLAAQFGERVEVYLISINTTVFDKSGNQITGLSKDDFELLEDGKPQKITHFLEVQNRIPVQIFTLGQTPKPEKVADPEKLPPTTQEALKERYILYMDNLNVHPLQRNQVIDKMKDFIRSRLTGEAEAMVVSYERSFKIRLPFTKNPDDVIGALEQVKMQTGEGMYRVQSRMDLIDQIQDDQSFSQAVAHVDNYAAEILNETSLTLRTLQDFLLSLAGVPGKKALLYICGGLPETAAIEMYRYLEDKFSNHNGMRYSDNYDMSSQYRTLINVANSSGISLYMVDATGLRSVAGQGIAEGKTQSYETDFTLESHNQTDELASLSEETGGAAVINTNDFLRGFRKVAATLDNYYFIGYQRGRAMEDRLHKIEIKVKSKKAYEVNFKRSFLEKSSYSQAADSLIAKMMLPVEENPYNIVVEFVQPHPLEGGAYALPITVKIPFSRIALIPQGGKQVGELRFGFVSKDAHGDRSEVIWKTSTFNIPDEAWTALQAKDFQYKAELAIQPGPSLVGVAVINPTDGLQSFKIERVVIETQGAKK